MTILATSPAAVRPKLPPPHSGWRDDLRLAIRDPAELIRVLRLPEALLEPAIAAARLFPLFAPWPFVERMTPGNPDDPLLRQVLPLGDEWDDPPSYSPDPVGDLSARVAPGLLHKYAGRALLITTGACAIHCRYCFRRHYPYHEEPKGLTAWEPALEHIAGDPSLHEIILSGGDPLTLVDDVLEQLVHRLAAIPHVVRLRVHTRLPIVIPRRVTDRLLGWLRGTRLAPIVVVHANHPQELDDAVATALGRLVDAGVPVLNQAVLLRGINDEVGTLAELCERLVNLRVLPYYLHHLDRVTGAAHFETSLATGTDLIARLRQRLPGYAIPQYVQELPPSPYKIPLS